ncbi:MAG: biotin/lipoyl-binding protein, partial [Nitrospirae bacterium]|nr:biotin/lipoyl-binding protein [Nitrospirota bacterium]
MKRMLLVMLGGGALFAVVYIYLGATSDRTAESTLKLSGNIEAHESVVSFKLQGRIVELPVQEGQFVKQGDLLARLDDDDYRQQVSVDEATVRAREAELDLALAGSRTQEVQEAKQNVVDAQADLALKQQELRRRRALLAEQGVSQ